MQVLELDPSEITDLNEGRIREDLGAIEELAKSIKEKGQIHPILITSEKVLIAGGRRRAACKLLGRKVNAIIRENTSEVELRELELEENLMRKDLTWQERVKGIAELDKLKKKIHGEKGPGPSQAGWSLTKTAELAGINRHRAHEVVTLDKAMQAFPELATAKSEKDARKMLAKFEEKILLAELTKRQKEAGNQPALFASENFIIKDAFEGLVSLPSESVDFANVDTPYGINLTDVKKIQSGVRTDSDYTEWERADYLQKAQKVVEETYRILKPNSWMVYWFGIQWYSQVLEVIKRAGFDVDFIPGIWYGGEGGAQLMQPEKMFARSYDTFFLCRKGAPIMVHRGHVNVFVASKVPPQNKIHPTEKPFQLMKDIFECLITPGSIVLSPFLGSGNDLRVAYSLGCHAFGFELDENLKNKFILRVEQDIKEGLYEANTPDDSGSTEE